MRLYPQSDEGYALPEFGTTRNRIGVMRIPLDTALNNRKFEIAGTALWCARTSSPTIDFTIRFHDEDSGAIPFRENTFCRIGPFSRVFIDAAAQAGQWADLVYAVDAANNIEFANLGKTVQDVELTKPANAYTHPDTSVASGAVATIPANSIRREILIQSLAANPGVLRVSNDVNNPPNATKGIELQPGQTITLHQTMAVYVFNGNAAAQTISVMEIHD